MAHGLARAGHQVIVVSRALSEAKHYTESDGVEVYRILPRLNLNSTPVLWRLNRWWEGYHLAVATQLRQILRERQIDLIESPELHAEPLLHSLFHSKPPFVVRLHTGSGVVMNFEPNPSKPMKRDARFERWLIGNAAHVTSPSKALLTSTLNGRASERCTVIPNPVDTDHFRPHPPSSDSNSIPNVICVGRPRYLKGFHVVARAIPIVWEAIPEARFTFIPAPMGKTGGSLRDAYAGILGNLIDDPRVQLIDPVGRERMPAFYRDATVCVVPSLWEGFGYVCAEAMACGIPVVAGCVGGMAEIVEDGKSGVLVEPGNAPALAQTIISLLRDADRRGRLGAAARVRIVENFSSPVITGQMANLYREVVQGAVG